MKLQFFRSIEFGDFMVLNKDNMAFIELKKIATWYGHKTINSNLIREINTISIPLLDLRYEKYKVRNVKFINLCNFNKAKNCITPKDNYDFTDVEIIKLYKRIEPISNNSAGYILGRTTEAGIPVEYLKKLEECVK
jgi:hypothetical protein